jgi:hypothetical protein
MWRRVPHPPATGFLLLPDADARQPRLQSHGRKGSLSAAFLIFSPPLSYCGLAAGRRRTGGFFGAGVAPAFFSSLPFSIFIMKGVAV